jgi:hypothetical protein
VRDHTAYNFTLGAYGRGAQLKLSDDSAAPPAQGDLLIRSVADDHRQAEFLPALDDLVGREKVDKKRAAGKLTIARQAQEAPCAHLD